MRKEIKYSLIIAAMYLLFGVTWIIFSDAAVAGIAKDAETFRSISSYKGVAFVLVSAFLIFALVVTYYRRYTSYQDKYNEIHKEEDRIFQDLPIGATILSLNGTILKVNRSLCVLLGYKKEEFLQLDAGFFANENAEEDALLQRVLKMPDVPCHANLQLLKSDRSRIWCVVNCILIRDAEDNFKHFILNVQDIDRELRMQQRVLRLNQDLLEAQRMGKFGHWHYNFDFHKVLLSPQACEILAVASEQPSAEEVVALFEPKMIEDFTAKLEAIGQSGGRIHSFLTLKHAEHGLKHLEVEAEMGIDDLDGSIVLKGTIKDVTLVMSLQYEKENFNKSLVHWAFKLSHELRKPISSILGVSQIMNEKLVKQNELEQLHEYLHKAATELDEQTRDLAEQFHYMQKLLKENPQDTSSDAGLYVLPSGDLKGRETEEGNNEEM